jgi:succinyl-diaminopimelate desuccinylase
LSGFDRGRFLSDLAEFVGFRTVVCRNKEEFVKANAWIKGFFDPATVDLVEFDCHGLTSFLIKPRGSERPNILGDGHIEVVPGEDDLFELKEQNGILTGRGVADMKTQCLMMIWVLKRLIEEGRHNDFWLLFSEDEEVGSHYGVKIVADYLQREGLMPKVIFAPDGGPNFSYVEKEKGIMTFAVALAGRAAHASRPYLGDNAIDRAMRLYERLRETFPNPEREEDWVVSVSMTTIEAGEAANQIPDGCRAGFDLRLTEDHTVEEIVATVRALAEEAGGELEIEQADPATYYPREAPIAQRYLDILRRVSGEEPKILHSAGASNGRLYVARDPRAHVLMSSPRMGGSHAEGECLDASSLEPYYRLVLETALMEAA